MLRLLRKREEWPFPAPGGRLVLRPLQRPDVERIRVWFGDPELTRLAFGTRADEEALERLAGEYCREIETGHRNALAIWTRGGDFIGFVRFSLRRERHGRVARVGILLGNRERWNRGYGTEAMLGLLAYLFDRRDVATVELDTADFNHRAQRCFEKCGFRRRRTQDLISQEDGTPCTKVWMDLSRLDWELLTQ